MNELRRRSVLGTEAGTEGLKNDCELSVFLNILGSALKGVEIIDISG